MNPIRKITQWYFKKESLPYWCILIVDCFILTLSGILLSWLRYDFDAFLVHPLRILKTLLVYVAFSLIGFRLFHTYAGIIRYSSFVDLQKIAYANLLSMVLVIMIHFPMVIVTRGVFMSLNTRSIILMYILATLLMWAYRILVKILFEVSTSDQRAKRVLIYGVHDGGIGLAKSIRTQQPVQYILKGFIAHEKQYKHHLLMGEKVYDIDDDLVKVIENHNIQAVIVSPLRNNDFRSDTALQDLLINANVKILMAEAAKEWTGEEEFSANQLREVSVEDLLPREEIKIDMMAIGRLLAGKRILITGSAGSIGSEMVRQIAPYKPSAMVLIDQAETPQHDIRLMMARKWPDIPCETIVTSICKEKRMEDIFSAFRPDYVFHAAAYKHVPMMEDNPCEAIQNNVYGTKVLADLSVKYGVKKFVMVSTDKAVNPTNVMGCSKRICEIYVQALNNRIHSSSPREDSSVTPNYNAEGSKTNQAIIPSEGTKGGCQFVTTRFGNVLGSNGSVIPLFQEQIKKGGPVTVTHPDIIRFFMLIPEACKLVLEAGTKGNGGEIFVFDMGKPVRIADLAARMIKLSGAKNVEIKYTGLRPGEKLYEEVLNEEENTKPSFHEKIRIADVREYDFEVVGRKIDELIEISKHYDDMDTVRKMKEIVPEYKSKNSIYEQLDK